MKVKTVIISVVVSASLVAGVGYGAYYAIRGKATPVEVVPVANVNQYYGWGDEDGNTVYGTITSQVAQTVSLNQDYQVADIYVQEGQKVKEGEALFSYDMTLPELADKSGVSVNTIRKMERGERVKLDMMELIAEAFGKKIKVILE